MAIKGKSTSKNGTKTGRKAPDSLSLPIANRGIKTGAEFAQLMSSLMTDILSGRVAPELGNAVCNAGGKLLKVVEMQYKYGTQSSQGERTLLLSQ